MRKINIGILHTFRGNHCSMVNNGFVSRDNHLGLFSLDECQLLLQDASFLIARRLHCSRERHAALLCEGCDLLEGTRHVVQARVRRLVKTPQLVRHGVVSLTELQNTSRALRKQPFKMTQQ